MWEVDWSNIDRKRYKVWARNPNSHIRKARQWHFVGIPALKIAGVCIPQYRKDSWEIDWNKRRGKSVWARNPQSKMLKAREWHWIDHSTLDRAGLKWKPMNAPSGRHTNSGGYVVLTRRAMDEQDIEIAKKNDLFMGRLNRYVLEHRLIAAKKYGSLTTSELVRHINGIKSDNRPENIIKGTTQENTADHNTARLNSMFWRERYIEAEKEILRLNKKIKDIKSGEAIKQIEMALKETA